MIDISRGGAGLENGPALPAGSEVTLETSGVAKPIPARIAKTIGTLVRLSFRQDTVSLTLIDEALKIVGAHGRAVAA